MQVGWVDLSAQDRSRTLAVLSSLSQPGAVDELGIGIVRDAIADVLFPGTSTLLTKARYFFLVPYLLRYMEKGHDADRRDPRSLAGDFRNLERQCAEGLLGCCASTEGIIGRVALGGGRWVTRGPGELYWAPLRNLGFMRSGAPSTYGGLFRYLSETRYKEKRTTYERDAGQNDGLSDDLQAFGSMWHIPRETYAAWKDDWQNWKDRASIDLKTDEAVFLRKQIVSTHPESLYSLLMTNEALRSIAIATFDGSAEGAGDSSFHTFLHNGALDCIANTAPHIARACALAEGFSEMVYGCRIAYNMQLCGLDQRGSGEWEEFAPRASEVASRVDMPGIASEFGLEGRAGFAPMSAFIGRAIECMQRGDLKGLKREVRKRETSIKGARRKIGRNDQGDYAWRGGRRLSYRFANAVSLIREISEAGGCDA